MASSEGWTPVAAKRVQAPGGGFSGALEPRTPMARPVSSKVSRIAASARARAKLGEGRWHARVQLLLDMRVERPGRDHAPILGLDPAAGKDELARHEPVAGMPLAHQHARFSALRTVDQNERRRITRAQRAFPRGGVSHVLVPMCDPNPCMPRAHC